MAAAFAECAATLARAHSTRDAEAPDASSLRDLQEYLQDFIKNEGTPEDVRYAAFFVDMLISDAFRNFFGDLVYSKIADEARAEACVHFATLFNETAAAVRNHELAAQAAGAMKFVGQYLTIVRRLNDAFVVGSTT